MLRDPGWLLWLLVVAIACTPLYWIIWPEYGRIRDSPPSSARCQMANFATAIDQYVLMNEKLPGSLQDLRLTDESNPHPFMKRIPNDPWGNPYELWSLPGKEFRIRCSGEDGKPFTRDDIWWPERDEP